MPQTKIICTMGPACQNEETLREMMESGMNVARLNFSHGSHEQHAATIARLRGLADSVQVPLAILQDLSGPKIRIGDVPGGAIPLNAGECLSLSGEPDPLPADTICLPYAEIIRATPVGARLLLDDGAIQLQVDESTGTELRCHAVVGGVLKSRKGVNIPGVSIPVDCLTPKDFEDLKFGISQDVDWIAQSFVRGPEDIRRLRRLISAEGADTPIIAKIEQHEAVDHLDGIIAAADGVMVARGDLGVELPIEDVPMVQKRIIRACNAAGKPVITATQMLESMIQNPRPTRAEVTDVCNAILDGTDAIMLSAETAAGAYPVETVKTMCRVAERAESALQHRAIREARSHETGRGIPDAISEATVEIAERLGVTAIVCATSSGATARMVSRFRPVARIIAATTSTRTWNRLAISWGVYPLLVPRAASFDATLDNAVAAGLAAGFLRAEDVIIFTAGSAVGSAGSTNLIKVHVVGRHDHFS